MYAKAANLQESGQHDDETGQNMYIKSCIFNFVKMSFKGNWQCQVFDFLLATKKVVGEV